MCFPAALLSYYQDKLRKHSISFSYYISFKCRYLSHSASLIHSLSSNNLKDTASSAPKFSIIVIVFRCHYNCCFSFFLLYCCPWNLFCYQIRRHSNKCQAQTTVCCCMHFSRYDHNCSFHRSSLSTFQQ